MKKRIISMAAVIALILCVGATASASLRWSTVTRCIPVLGYSGTTANCSVSIKAIETTAKVSATLSLIRVNGDGTEATVKVWSGLSGTGSLSYSNTFAPCTSGVSYKLVVTATVTDSTGTESVSEYTQLKRP